MKSYKDLFSLKGKNVIITGGAGILGQYFSHGVCEMGASLAIFDYNKKAADELKVKLQDQFDVKVLSVHCDVSNVASVKEAVGQTINEMGEIHVLHNNAASKSEDLNAFFETFENYSIEEWKKITSVNLDGMFLMSQAVGKHMVEKKIRGSIVNTASIYGVVAPDQRIYEGSEYLNRKISSPAVYTASKAGVVGLTKYLASYWGAKGIRVNTLTPGGVESGQNETFKKNYSNRIPMGRMAEASEMVGALIYLSSDASSYVTGQNIIIDGGLTAW